MNNVLKVLVVDDSATHREAAKAQLMDCDLMVVASYDEAFKLLGGEEGWDRHDFDVVLTDLLMPASKKKMGPEGMELAGQQMPVGIFLVLMAAKNGARYVGLLSDMDHHGHPASAAIDPFLGGSLKIESAKVQFNNQCADYFLPDLITEDPGWKHPDKVWTKNWREALDKLLSNDSNDGDC